jgi:hypothetical protein
MLDEIAERLSGIAEELADAALERLRSAAETGIPDPSERVITRARRSVEKAAALLRSPEQESQ